MKKWMAGILTVAMVVPCVTSCGGSGNGNGDYTHLLTREDGDLYVRYFKGGNGEEWLYPIADAFEKETGITVYLECDDEITENIPVILEGAHPTSGSPSASMLQRLPDVCMTQTLKWQEYVNKGWLADIDEVYTYQYADEGNVTLSDKLIDGADKFGYMGQTPDDAANGDKHYWVVPWTSPLTGIIYNVNMLKDLGGKWANGYVPATVSELLELVEDLSESGKTAFSWGGDSNGMGYWNFLFMSLWASYQGYDVSYNGGKAEYGSMMDFYNFVDEEGNMDSGYESFNQAGRKIALQVIQDLIVDTSSSDSKNWTWKNSIDYPVSKTAQQAQDKFAFEEAAMIPTGSWIKNEIAEVVEDDFEYAMMPTPVVDMAYVQSVATKLGLKEVEIHGGLYTDGTFETAENTGKTYAQINNTEIGDLMFIPRNATKKAEAIKFLQFVNKMSNVESATVDMGIARPFKYTPSALSGHSDFTKTVFSVYESQNAVNLIRISESSIFAYATIKEWAERNETDVLLQLSSRTVNSLVAEIYLNASDNWTNWCIKAGLL
jgi:ABC-type glycerol-3-phosphate transport system substrate-binding protein